MTPSVCLGEICTFTGGGTPSRKISEYWNGDIPWATVKDFASDRISQTMERISRAGLTNSATRIVPAGTVLLVTRVGLGKVAIAEIDLAINQDVKALFPSSGVVPEYLLWALKHVSPNLLFRGTGATVKGVTLKDVKELKIPLPPLDEQRRIVGILNRSAKIERMRARARELMGEFMRALFVKMFGDPVENPMGWDVRPLGAYCILTQYGTSKKATNQAAGLPVLRMGNVTYCGDLDCTDLKWIALSESDVEKHILRTGDILFNRTNSKALVGKTGIWDGRCEAVSASYFIRLRLDETSVCPTYVWAFMNSKTMKQRLFESARGAIGQANINAKELKSFLLPVPPLDLQHRYADLVETARSALGVAESYRSDTSALQSSLMSRLLDGVA